MEHTSEEECAHIRGLRRDGLSFQEIADITDRSMGTVRRHCIDACQHDSGTPARTLTLEEIVQNVRQMADERGYVPAKTAYNEWPARLCHSKTIKRLFDHDWDDVLEAAELATVAPNSPRAIRKAAYDNPHLATGFETRESYANTEEAE